MIYFEVNEDNLIVNACEWYGPPEDFCDRDYFTIPNFDDLPFDNTYDMTFYKFVDGEFLPE